MPSEVEFQSFFSLQPRFAIPFISAVKPLREFIHNYPNEELIPNLIQLEKDYHNYHAINGDGNCFYRAIIFQYLTQAELHHYEHLFPPADLLICQNLPFSLPTGCTSQAILCYIWQTYLLPLSDLNTSQRESQLITMLNKSINLDAVLIAYLRGLNFSYLSTNKHEFLPFSQGSIEQDLQRMRMFGQESEGVELFTLARILDAQITVLMVHRENYQQVHLNNNSKHTRSFVVSFRPGHYDIPVAKQQEKGEKGRREVKSNGSSYGTASFSRFLKRDQRDQRDPSPRLTPTPTSRQAYPEVISVANASEIKKITVKNPDHRGSRSIHPISSSHERKVPKNMKEFSKTLEKSRRSSEDEQPSTVHFEYDRDQDTSRPSPSSVTSSKMPRTSLGRQRDQVKQQRMMGEAAFCILAVVVLVAGLFAL